MCRNTWGPPQHNCLYWTNSGCSMSLSEGSICFRTPIWASACFIGEWSNMESRASFWLVRSSIPGKQVKLDWKDQNAARIMWVDCYALMEFIACYSFKFPVRCHAYWKFHIFWAWGIWWRPGGGRSRSVWMSNINFITYLPSYLFIDSFVYVLIELSNYYMYSTRTLKWNHISGWISQRTTLASQVSDLCKVVKQR